MIKYLITIILTVALCCACDGEDFSADPTLMPPATQTGANTFGCLIDGWVSVSYTHLDVYKRQGSRNRQSTGSISCK